MSSILENFRGEESLTTMNASTHNCREGSEDHEDREESKKKNEKSKQGSMEPCLDN